jgi:hypothetical protein
MIHNTNPTTERRNIMTSELIIIINTILNELKNGRQFMNILLRAPLAKAIMKKWPDRTEHLYYAAPETCQSALLPYGVKFIKILHKGRTRYVLGTYAWDRSDGRNLMLDLLDI